MLEGLLTRQPQAMTSRDREAQYFLHILDETAEPCLAVKTIQIRLLGDFALLAARCALEPGRAGLRSCDCAGGRGPRYAGRGEGAAAIQLYQGDLLPSCYDEWIGAERDRLQQLYQGALERLLELLEQARNYAAAIRVAQRLLRLDPLQEATYRHLMRLYAARGARGSILRTYQNCAAVLKHELAVQPGLTTRKTYEQLMRAED
jgi:tetratricopeptide (TPR) repeat protein